MYFTRDPIIETVITPREGYKISIRSSVSDAKDEYLVESVEVVSFGPALFFRSLEKPNPFLLPVIAYSVVEIKEVRMVLKNIAVEKSIKITGNKEKEEKKEDKKKKRPKQKKTNRSIKKQIKEEKVEDSNSSVVRKLIPPPNVLIKERIKRFQENEEELFLPKVEIPHEEVVEKEIEKKKEE